MVVQWLGFCAFTVEILGSIPGQGTEIPQAMQSGQKREGKSEVNTQKYIPEL